MRGPFQSMEEVASEYGSDDLLLVRLFAIWESRGGGERKSRVIANFRESGVNLAWGSDEQYTPDTIGRYGAACVAMQRAFPGEVLRGWATDYKGWYRQDPLHPSSYKFAVAVYFDSEVGLVRFGYYTAQPFGAAAAVNNACRNTVAMVGTLLLSFT